MSSIGSTRNHRIDLLRGTAISVVLLLHFHLAYGLHKSAFAEWIPVPLLKMLLINGNFGVTIFFVISGFLITSATLQRYGTLAAIDWRTFYVQRAARIWPPLLLALAIIVSLGCLGLSQFANTDGDHHLPASFFWLAAGSVLTFWHNVLMQQVGWFNYALNVYWSLSVEEVFYLAFPMLCLLLKRERWLIAVWMILMALGPYYRSLHADDELFFECGYLACFDAIAMGCIAAIIAKRTDWGRYLGNLVQMLLALLLVACYLRGIYGHEVWGFSLVAMVVAILLIGVSQHAASLPARWNLLSRGVAWLGAHSYELYLFHIIVLAAMRQWIPSDVMPNEVKPTWLVTFLVVSMVLAGLLRFTFTEPINGRIRTWWITRRTNNVVLPA